MKKYIEHPFFRFYKAMVDEYNSHVPEKGDSWKTCKQEYLREVLNTAGKKYFDKHHPDELVDMANMEAMLWLRYTYVVDNLEGVFRGSEQKVNQDA